MRKAGESGKRQWRRRDAFPADLQSVAHVKMKRSYSAAPPRASPAAFRSMLSHRATLANRHTGNHAMLSSLLAKDGRNKFVAAGGG
jgi:hypothetical protein